MGKKQFIVITGIDGSGKTTLKDALATINPNWKFTDWKKFEKIINTSFDPKQTTTSAFIESLSPFTRSALFLYIYGLQHDKIIMPALLKGETIIADSYWYKFVAKMVVTNHGDYNLLKAFHSLPNPDKIILLDTSPEIAFKRKTTFNFYESFGDKSNFVNFQKEVRNKILSLIADNNNILVINDNYTLNSKIAAAIEFINT